MPTSLGVDDGAQWPVRLEVTTPALSSHVPPLRRRFNQWLGGDHVDADLVDDLTLAVSEALENCCDHAFEAELIVGTMTLTARAVDTRLVVDIADDGLWQVPGTGPTHRGRGLSMIRALVDEVDLVTGPDGTRLVMTQQLGH